MNEFAEGRALQIARDEAGKSHLRRSPDGEEPELTLQPPDTSPT
jgi:hypothetical protein